MADIRNRQEANAWLVDKDKPTIAALALRSALRALPFTVDIYESPNYQSQRDTLFLAAFRSSLSVALAAVTDEAKYWEDAEAAARLADLQTEPAYPSARSGNALYGWMSAALHTSYENHAENSIYVPAAAFRDDTTVEASKEGEAEQAFWETVSSDAFLLDGLLLPGELFETPLWSPYSLPPGVGDIWDDFVFTLTNGTNAWSFWIDWVQSLRDGLPLDWDLQREVAEISQEDWDRGTENIARIVAEILARRDLKAKIRALENELAEASKARLGPGGNNPPEPINDQPFIAHELTIVWEPLQRLKNESAATTPNKERIRKLINILLAALRRGIEWCGAKVDLVVDTTIRWAIPAAGGYVVLNPEKLEAVIEAANVWLSALP